MAKHIVTTEDGAEYEVETADENREGTNVFGRPVSGRLPNRMALAEQVAQKREQAQDAVSQPSWGETALATARQFGAGLTAPITGIPAAAREVRDWAKSGFRAPILDESGNPTRVAGYDAPSAGGMGGAISAIGLSGVRLPEGKLGYPMKPSVFGKPPTPPEWAPPVNPDLSYGTTPIINAAKTTTRTVKGAVEGGVKAVKEKPLIIPALAGTGELLGGHQGAAIGSAIGTGLVAVPGAIEGGLRAYRNMPVPEEPVGTPAAREAMKRSIRSQNANPSPSLAQSETLSGGPPPPPGVQNPPFIPPEPNPVVGGRNAEIMRRVDRNQRPGPVALSEPVRADPGPAPSAPGPLPPQPRPAPISGPTQAPYESAPAVEGLPELSPEELQAARAHLEASRQARQPSPQEARPEPAWRRQPPPTPVQEETGVTAGDVQAAKEWLEWREANRLKRTQNKETRPMPETTPATPATNPQLTVPAENAYPAENGTPNLKGTKESAIKGARTTRGRALARFLRDEGVPHEVASKWQLGGKEWKTAAERAGVTAPTSPEALQIALDELKNVPARGAGGETPWYGKGGVVAPKPKAKVKPRSHFSGNAFSQEPPRMPDGRQGPPVPPRS